jgi:hypothetical protein
MSLTLFPARQPLRPPWPREKLVSERAIAISHALDLSTRRNYGSACNSYLPFVCSHNLPADPTPDTLSFFVIYMSHHISPRSVATYLSGLVNQLEPFFPEIKNARHSRLVCQTLQGCHKMLALPTRRKRALTRPDVDHVLAHYASSEGQHDDLLFLSMFLTAFFALLRLGELTFPDDQFAHDWCKISCRSSVVLNDNHYSFTLPAHKADRIFEGSHILVCGEKFSCPSLSHFTRYLSSRDALFPLASPLWLTSAGTVPTRSFFIRRLRAFFPSDIAGQSLRARGATMLADLGVSPHIIQAAGHWSSEAFRIYVRKNPFLLQNLIFGHSSNESIASQAT